MGRVLALRCKECGREREVEPVAACEECWGALEPVYDMDAVRRTFTREAIASRPPDLWRYRELLPLDGEPTVGRGTGFTPLLRAPRSAAASASATSGSSTTRPATPRSRSRTGSWPSPSPRPEFGMDTVGCASTGNLANAVAAGAAAAGLRAVVLVPEDLEAAKVTGTAVFGADPRGRARATTTA